MSQRQGRQPSNTFHGHDARSKLVIEQAAPKLLGACACLLE